MLELTRRRFLEQSLAALAAGALIEPAAHAGRRVGANSRIAIAVIGVNGRGMDHIKGYLALDNVDIVAICDPDTAPMARAQDAVTKAGRPKPEGFQDIRKLLTMKGLDAVSIATPNHWHSLAGIWAMQHGKDVYVEKPVSHNVSEGRRLVEVARKTDRICQAGMQSRSHRACRDAIAYIERGSIGAIQTAYGYCYKSRGSIGKADGSERPPATADYDIWLGPAPQRPMHRRRFHYDWHWFWDYGNGDLGNQGIHQMDIARWAIGSNGLPKSVVSAGGRFGYEDDGETPNTVLSTYDYGDRRIVFEVRGLKTEGIHGVKIGNIIRGSQGYVAIGSDYGSALAFDNDDKQVRSFAGGGDHFGNFIAAVQSRKREDQHADVEQGHLSSALCHLGNISYRLGSTGTFAKAASAMGEPKAPFAAMEKHLVDNGVDIETTPCHVGPALAFDSASERFTSNAQANELLTRVYRKGFEVPAKA